MLRKNDPKVPKIAQYIIIFFCLGHRVANWYFSIPDFEKSSGSETFGMI
jgi:hypothetical protein